MTQRSREEEILLARGYCDGLKDLGDSIRGWIPKFPPEYVPAFETVLWGIEQGIATMDLFRQVLEQQTLIEGADDGRVDSGA